MRQPFSLENKRILVTGASSGIGKACAHAIAQAGGTVALVARDEQRLKSICDSLPGTGHQVFQCDLGDSQSITELFTRVCANRNLLQGIVHAAGWGPNIPLPIMTRPDLEKLFAVNYFSFMELAREFIKKKHAAGGSLIAISSVVANAGFAGGGPYCGSKGALEGSIRALAIELVSRGVRVNSIAPSNIRTPIWEDIVAANGEDAAREILARQPLGLGEPEDVAYAAVYLLSDASRFVTGTQLVVDGGYLAQ